MNERFRLIGAFALVAAVAIGLATPAGAASKKIGDGTSNAAGSVSEVLGTINAERRARHVRMLRLDRALCRIAREHALDMVQHRYFAHYSLDGRSPFDRMRAHHYRFGYAGENLALDVDTRSASEALWLSQEHRSNLLGPHYANVGIATVPVDGEVIVVEDFSD
jgi:uncharacterized protein YkwD